MNNELFDFPFYRWEKELSDKPFLKQPFGNLWESYTWNEVGLMARKLSSGLKSLGLEKNSHIGLVSKNCREWIIADLAISMAGYISVPFFPTLNSKEINNLLTFGDVKALFVGKLENWEEMKKGVDSEMPIIAFPQYKNHSKVEVGHKWHEFINKFEPQTEDFKPNLKDIWTIIFTSGTTGDPKGVVLTYETLFNTKRITEDGNPLKVDLKGNNSFISYMPLNHIFERVVIEHVAFRYGGTISFVESLETFGQNLNDIQPTAFQGVPRIYAKFQEKILMKMPQEKLDKFLKIPIISWIIKRKLKKALGMSKAKALVTGAAAMPLELLNWYKDLGIYITNGYGMTENCATCTNLNPYQPLGVGSVGKPTPGVDLKISDQGEILMRGPFILSCYYKNEEVTNETIKDGWLHTGDKGYIDDDGFLYITGRIKDMFKTSKGKYIEPGVLEAYFGDVSEFAQICVVGLGCDQPLLLAVPSESAIDDKESTTTKISKVLEKVNSNLDNYKKMSKVIFVKEDWLPENGMTTPTLKIKRSKIDEKFSDQYNNWLKAQKTLFGNKIMLIFIIIVTSLLLGFYINNLLKDDISDSYINKLISIAKSKPIPNFIKGKTGFARNSDVKIFYEDLALVNNPKATVLLINGAAESLIQWPDQMIRTILKNDFRVIRFDNRGVGESDWIKNWSRSNDYNLEEMARDALAVTNQLMIEKFHVIGYSTGGMIGQILAINYPEKILSLTI